MIRAGAREAWRLARIAAVVKVSDHVNSAHSRRETGWVIEAIGQEPYDVVHVLHRPVRSARWPDRASEGAQRRLDAAAIQAR